jgi:cold shock CspA family protein
VPRPGNRSTVTTDHAARPIEPSRGRVQRIYVERGFGFIKCLAGAADDVGQDFFFHHSGLDGFAIDDLEEGSMVLFEPTYVAKGKRAEKIQRTTIGA